MTDSEPLLSSTRQTRTSLILSLTAYAVHTFWMIHELPHSVSAITLLPFGAEFPPFWVGLFLQATVGYFGLSLVLALAYEGAFNRLRVEDEQAGLRTLGYQLEQRTDRLARLEEIVSERKIALKGRYVRRFLGNYTLMFSGIFYGGLVSCSFLIYERYVFNFLLLALVVIVMIVTVNYVFGGKFVR